MTLLLASAFLPTTLGGWAAVAAAGTASVAAVLGYFNRRHIQEVHVLVNSNLAAIKDQLERVTAERDGLVQDKITAASP